MTTKERLEQAIHMIVDDLEADIRGRRGIGQEWDQIEGEIVMKEIFPRWKEILNKHIAPLLKEA